MMDPHSGDTGNKVENARRCRRFFMAIIGQALKDASNSNEELRADAIDYLLNPERSEVMLEAIGLYPYAFRQKIKSALEHNAIDSITDTLRSFYEDSRVEADGELLQILHELDYSIMEDSICEKA